MDNQETVTQGVSQQPRPIELPSLEDILGKRVSFPFDEFTIWTQAFNHMRVKKGKNVGVSSTTDEKGKIIYTLILPENPTLREILQVTKEFIKTSEIDVNNPILLIFARDLKNTAIMLARLLESTETEGRKDTDQNVKKEQDEETELIRSLICSIYNFGLGLEEILNRDSDDLTVPPLSEISSFNILFNPQYNLPYDLPDGTNEQVYENEIFLRLLGKHHIYFDKQNQQDKKLSQVVEHSAYYYLFKRFVEERIDKQDFPSTYEERIEQFDQWLINHKLVILKNLIPYLSTSLSKDGRTSNALRQNIISRVFSFLDQAVDEEGWKKAKEELTSPPLFTDLGEEIQQILRDLFLIKDTHTVFGIDLSKLYLLSDIFKKIIAKYGNSEYKKMSLFDLAKNVLERAQIEKEKKGESLTNLEKITYLWDLVQAYEYEQTYKLTDAIEFKAFECNLRSYILGRFYQELMANEVDVYTVIISAHVYLLVVDKSTNKGYWVDPTVKRYIHKKGRRIPASEEILALYAIKELDSAEWEKIQSQLQVKPNSNIFGQYNGNFSIILPFTQGIETGFWINLFILPYEKAEYKNNDMLSYLKRAYYAIKKALELNPNDSDSYYNLAILYMEEEFANAIGLSYKQSLQEAFKHLKKALELNHNNPDYHNNLAILYIKEELTEDKEKYFNNVNLAFNHMYYAYKLDRSVNRIDNFFWIITQIPDEKTREIFNGLSDKTKFKIKLMMHERAKIIKQNKKSKELFTYSLGVENSFFWQLMQEWIEREKKEDPNKSRHDV